MNTTHLAATALAVALGAAWATNAPAQQGATQQRAAQQRQANYGANDPSRLDTATQGRTVRASTLIGRAIENPAEESVGEVEDIVLDARTGQIQYVAVTYGGFLGMGDKMFAVPYQAFRVTPDPDDPSDPNDFVLVLDVSQEKLEGAEGFDQDHWPDSTDPNFTRELNRRYGVSVRTDARNGGVDVDVNRNGVNVRTGGDR